jgi:SAM-dependent methyltransferase
MIVFISNGFKNSDDRIYKYLIKNYNIKELFENQSIDILISGCVKHPTKYILRRLKELNYIMNISEHFNTILAKALYTIKDDENSLIENIIKYYYHETANMSMNEITQLMNILFDGNNYKSDKTFKLIQYIYEKTNTNLEKNYIVFQYIVLVRSIGDFRFKPMNSDEKKIFDELIIQRYNYTANAKDIIPLDCIGHIMELYTMEERMKLFKINFTKISNMMYFLPYSYGTEGTNIMEFNKLRFHLSVFIRKQKKYKAIIRKIRMFPILNEIKKIVPQLRRKKNVHHYNKIPPYHLFPGMLQHYARIKSDFLLREKADGIMVHNLPANIYPPVEFGSEIKAEYIEDLDLYLVHDIDMEGTAMDRLMYIFKQHKTPQAINNINNMMDMIDKINMEREKLKRFLDEPYVSYRWYPKPAWYIDNMIPFVEILHSVINSGDIVKWLCEDGIVKNDGFILTPMDGSREIKIKPKSHYTIDLEHIDGKFYDREGNIWYVKNNDEEKSNNTIWRCYPSSSDYFVKELRHDKTKANTGEICDTIRNLYYANYMIDNIMIYNEKTEIILPEWDIIVLSNIANMKNVFSKVKEFNGNVLDCGCGNGRNLKHMVGTFKYFGLDIDINMLGSAITHNTKAIFSYYDFNIPYNDNKLWINFNKKKFDYILCINSLMHFNTDTFWELLDMIVKPGTIMIFNLLDMDNIKYHINMKYYIERKCEMVEYMFPIHNSIKTERYIDNINEILNKYSWKIISTDKFINNNLTDNYRWYIVIKN